MLASRLQRNREGDGLSSDLADVGSHSPPRPQSSGPYDDVYATRLKLGAVARAVQDPRV